METHETYVSLETAKLLKQAGFDWEVYRCYETLPEKKKIFGRHLVPYQGKAREDVLPAPTLEVAQRWLREVKSVFLYAEPLSHTDYSITWIARKLNGFTTQEYATHEEAQEAGEKKALEMILEKGE